MTDLPETLLKQLEEIAQDENRTPADLLESLLSGYMQMRGKKVAKRGTLADFARAMQQANIGSDHPVDISSRVNEIMRMEFADYVRRNMDRD